MGDMLVSEEGTTQGVQEATYSLLHCSDGLKIPMPPHRGGRARRLRSVSFGGEIPRSAGKRKQ